MRPEEIFDPPRGQRDDGEGFGLVELHIADGQGHCEFRVGSSDYCVEVLEDFFNGNGEGEIAADELERMVLSNRVTCLLLR